MKLRGGRGSAGRCGRVVAVLSALVLVMMPGPAVATADPDLDRQYGLAQIGAPDAWSITKGQAVVIAVVDTGVDPGHEDLAANLMPAYNASRRSTAGTQDDSGHGTHVAGIAAAVLDNGRGGAGVAPASKLLPIKVFDGGPLEATTEIAVAVRYALSQGARVINLSISSLYPDLPVSDLEGPCNDAFANGALCVIAAGNRGEASASGFSRGVDAVVVTAHDARGNHAPFASRADTKWALSAPGVAVHSTLPGGRYGIKDGTSMAAPHVAGAAALLFSKGLTARQVAERLVATATPTINPAVDGAGRLDAAAAVGVARSGGAAAGGGAGGGQAPADSGGGESPAAKGGAAPDPAVAGAPAVAPPASAASTGGDAGTGVASARAVGVPEAFDATTAASPSPAEPGTDRGTDATERLRGVDPRGKAPLLWPATVLALLSLAFVVFPLHRFARGSVLQRPRIARETENGGR